MKAAQPGERSATLLPILDVRMHPGKAPLRGALRYDPTRLLQADPLVLPFPHDAPIAVCGDYDAVVTATLVKLRESGYAGASRLGGDSEAPVPVAKRR